MNMAIPTMTGKEDTDKQKNQPHAQTTNGGQPLKCTAPDGSVRLCMSSKKYNQDPSIAKRWSRTEPREREIKHKARTNGFKLCRAPDGKLYPLIDHAAFMAAPSDAIEEWKTTYSIQPVKKKPFRTSFPRRDRICECPPRTTLSLV